MRHDKRGFLIYRCTYAADDAAWDRFKQIIKERSHQHIVESDVPEVVNSPEWTFVEDRTTWEGASKEFVPKNSFVRISAPGLLQVQKRPSSRAPPATGRP